MIETVTEARKALSGILLFGDDLQIRAVRFLQAVEEVKESIETCDESHDITSACHVCDGRGEHECGDCNDLHDCGECDGQGFMNSNTPIGCKCTEKFSHLVIGEALRDARHAANQWRKVA